MERTRRRVGGTSGDGGAAGASGDGEGEAVGVGWEAHLVRGGRAGCETSWASIGVVGWDETIRALKAGR